MSEEEKKKKGPGRVRRAVRAAGPWAVAILLLLSVVLQAPRKASVVLVIILLAITVLPVKLRKWFWLSVGVVVIALVVWVLLPGDGGEWRRYTFDKAAAELKTKYAIPDHENAAIIYNRLLKDSIEYPRDSNFSLPMREPWTGEEHPELAEWLGGQRGKIRRLVGATKIKKCRFPIFLDVAMSEEWGKRSQAVRRWAFLLVTAGSNDMGEGRIDEGVEKYVAAFELGKHQRQQPVSEDVLVGIAIEALAMGQFKRFIIDGEATEERLRVIGDALAGFEDDWDGDFLRILEYEKLATRHAIGRYYEVNARGRIRLSRDPYAEMRDYLKRIYRGPEERKRLESQAWYVLEPTRLQKKLIRARTILYWFYLPSSPGRAGELIDEVFLEKYYKMREADFDWADEPPPTYEELKLRINRYRTFELMTGLMGNPYYRIRRIYFRVLSGQRGCQILIGLRRYKNENGSWPQTLEDIEGMVPAEAFIDPTNGGAFVYKVTEEGFRLYSRGENSIDEDGVRESGYMGAKDDWVIWPKRRKAREETTDAEKR